MVIGSRSVAQIQFGEGRGPQPHLAIPKLSGSRLIILEFRHEPCLLIGVKGATMLSRRRADFGAKLPRPLPALRSGYRGTPAAVRAA